MRKFFLIIVLLLSVIFAGILLGDLIFQKFYPFPETVNFGVTFSPKFTSDLGMDWKEVYISMLDELKVKRLRLPTYWDTIEVGSSKYDFSTTDFMLEEAQKKGAQAILILGVRQPRWPECHIPTFVRDLSVSDRQKKILEFVQTVVERYKSHPSIIYWQVENESLLGFFGEGCDKPDRKFLRSEVELVRSLDKRPLILTDSGELRPWVTPMKLSDIFGTSLYRTVYNKNFGFINYPILPYLYNVKSALVRSIFAPNNQKTIIIELQAEPWSPNNDLLDIPISKQTSIFSIEKFKDNINFAKRTGFSEAYLWGAEWWYFMEKQGDSSYLNYAKTLFL